MVLDYYDIAERLYEQGIHRGEIRAIMTAAKVDYTEALTIDSYLADLDDDEYNRLSDPGSDLMEDPG